MNALKVSCDIEGIQYAVKIIREGGVIIFPTDTIYGIGCDPYNKKTIQIIYKIKKRSVTKSFPVLGYSKKEILEIAEIDEMSEKIIEKFWPGKITLILKLKDKKLAESLNLDEKIAVRVPQNQCALALLKECKLLIGTSANISGEKPFSNPSEYYENMPKVDAIIDGGIIQNYKESTIVEIIENKVKIVREGEITEQEIMEIF